MITRNFSGSIERFRHCHHSLSSAVGSLLHDEKSLLRERAFLFCHMSPLARFLARKIILLSLVRHELNHIERQPDEPTG